jgi:hypothetical protein
MTVLSWVAYGKAPIAEIKRHRERREIIGEWRKTHTRKKRADGQRT